METENALNSGTVPETELPADTSPEVVDTAPSSEPVSEAPATEKDARKIPSVPQWMEDRLNKEVGRHREKERQLEQARAEIEALRAAMEDLRKTESAPAADGTTPQPTSKPNKAPVTTPDPNEYVPRSEVERLATEKARMDAFNAESNRTYFEGKAKFSDWDDSLKPLQVMGATGSVDFLDAALASGDASFVLHYLGNRPDEASRIMVLNPTRMAAEMAKIAITAAKPNVRPVSSAPTPIRPIAGGGSPSPQFDPDKGSMNDFSDWWDKRQAERAKMRR